MTILIRWLEPIAPRRTRGVIKQVLGDAAAGETVLVHDGGSTPLFDDPDDYPSGETPPRAYAELEFDAGDDTRRLAQAIRDASGLTEWRDDTGWCWYSTPCR